MFADFIITFRETLEAALIVGIVLSYLGKIGNREWFKTVYCAIIAAIVASLGAAYLFDVYLGGFEGMSEQLYEGIVMILAAMLITWMVVWMLRQRHFIAAHLREKVDQHVKTERKWAMFLLVFVAVLREGIETVLFLKASSLQAGGNHLFAAALGVLVAMVLGYLLFTGLKRIPMKQFFTVTSVILVLFAAGLLAHGVHELQEAGVVTVGMQQAWDVNPEVLVEGVFPLLHEKGVIGEMLKHVFGWNGNPSVLEVASYVLYLLLVLALARFMSRQPKA